MISRRLIGFTSAIAWTLLTLPVSAQTAEAQHGTKHSHYRVVDVGTFGGPTSGVNFNSRIINSRGAVVGGADTSVLDPNCGCYVALGFKWQHGHTIPLGPLPGGANTFAIEINGQGVVGGISENGQIDPTLGAPAFEAVNWERGVVTPLGTFGGSYSLPSDIDRAGNLVGGAETVTPDPFNFGGLAAGLPSPTQWHAVLWHDGHMRDLGTLGDGEDTFAFFINGRGQIVGDGFTSSIADADTGVPPIDPFFWDDGHMVDIGTLGGAVGTVSGLNDSGQVVGASNLAGNKKSLPYFWYRGALADIGTLGGDSGSATWINQGGNVVGAADLPGSLTHHAYLWNNGVMKNLGTIGSDPCSRADSINDRGQIVGESAVVCVIGPTSSFLWENGGPALDLNVFVTSGSGIHLSDAAFINDEGEIASEGTLNGEPHAFVLVPDGDCDAGCEREIAAYQNQPRGVRNPASSKHASGSPTDSVSKGEFGMIRRLAPTLR